MPTFCRHNRFIERCPICSKTLPGEGKPHRGGGSRAGGKAQRRAGGASSGGARRGRLRATDVRVYVDGRRRGVDDGYECELVPGLHSSLDARRLAQELGFSAGRLSALAQRPPGPYELAAELGRRGDLERASWLCMLIAYLSPLEGEDPFASIISAPSLEQAQEGLSDEALEALALGPRACHQPGRGAMTLRAYLAWAQRAGSQQRALIGEESWSAERRFERVFERLALPGFPRWGRYEMLVLLGALGLYDIGADSLHLAAATASRAGGAARGESGDLVLAAAKRVFGIGDIQLLERRCGQLAKEAGVPIAALDLALFNWHGSERVTLGLPADISDEQATAQAELALGL
jgi:hypothetical protein